MVVLIYVSLMPNDVARVFVCSLAISLSLQTNFYPNLLPVLNCCVFFFYC